MLPIQLVIVSVEDWNIEANFETFHAVKKHAHMKSCFCLDFPAFVDL